MVKNCKKHRGENCRRRLAACERGDTWCGSDHLLDGLWETPYNEVGSKGNGQIGGLL